MRLPHPALAIAACLLAASCSAVEGAFMQYAPLGVEKSDASEDGAVAGNLDGAPREGDAGGGGGPSRSSRARAASMRELLERGGASGAGEHGGVAGIEAARRLAGEAELRPPAPVLLARPDGSEQRELPLAALRVATWLSATRARTLVDCIFENPHARVLQGTLMVRLPEGASPARLAMFQGQGPAYGTPAETFAGPGAALLLPPRLEAWAALGAGELPLPPVYAGGSLAVHWGELRPARVVGAERGKVVYERITRRRIDPALLEWAGGNSFSARIFPIAANGRKRVVLVYDQEPLSLGGRAALPLAVPAKLPPAFRLEVAADARAWTDARLHSAGAEEALEAVGGAGLDRRDLDLSGRTAEGAFLLSAAPADARVQSGFAEESGIAGPLVHARLRPEVALREDAPTGDALLLVDTSLSGRSQLAASFGRLLREVLERDATIGRFHAFAFDVTVHSLTGVEGFVPNTPAARAAALERLSAVRLEGATSLELALSNAERLVGKEGPLPTVFLLSDAQVTWGVEEARDLLRAHPRLARARWICYRLGDAAVNRPLVEALTREGGRIVTIAGASDVEAGALAHRARPLALAGVRVEGIAARDVVTVGAPRALFPGQTLEVAFRAAPGDDPRRASVVLETEEGPRRFPLAAAVPGDRAAARAWAEASARALLELEDRDADGVALALSQRFGIANRVASFIILETDAEYVQHAVADAAIDLDTLARSAEARVARRPAGAPDDPALDERARAFLASIAGARGREWTMPLLPRITPEQLLRRSLLPPAWGDRVDPVLAWRSSEAFRRANDHAEALRILSSIVEDAPRDAAALRLVAFVLFERGSFEAAASLFGRARRLRPFEPQALLCEALALEAHGRAADAALRLEVALAGRFDPRWERFAKEAARRQYARLLDGIAAPHAEAARERARALGIEGIARGHEVTLFWSIDDADLDMHVLQPGFFGREVSYERRSAGGGTLLWDNTAGLGPEVYVHPHEAPAEVFVRYYGTLAVEGTVPAATLLVTRRPDGAAEARATVLAGARERVTVWSSEERVE
jgi:tetratricopeptide (TPR) repeat protein